MTDERRVTSGAPFTSGGVQALRSALERGSAAPRAVRAIILDAGGVILHPDLDWIGAQVAELQGQVTRPQLFQAYYRTIHELDLTPTMSPNGPAFTGLEIRVWFFQRLLHHAGVQPTDAMGTQLAQRAMQRFPRESDIYHWAMPDTRQRLQRLCDAGFLLGSASNNDDALEAQLEHVGVRDLFRSLKDSGREGVAKPDPELLLRAARELGASPEHCVFVGDVDRVDGQAARAAGMAFALLDPLDQPRPTRPLCIPTLDALLDHFAPMA